MKSTASLGCSLLLTVALAVPVLARPQAAPAPAAANDGAAYTTFFNEQNPQKKAELGEKFVVDYKTSQYADPVFRTTVTIYEKAGNSAKVMEMANKLDATVPAMAPASKAQIYAKAMVAAQQANNAAQTIVFADKVLALAPEDLNTLITLSSTIPAATPQDKAAIAKAEGYAGKALTLVASLDPKTIGLSDADWGKQKAGIEATLHTTLGQIALNNQDLPKAEEHLNAAIKATPKDGLAWYLLGLVHYQQSTAATKAYVDAVKANNDAIAAKEDQFKIDELKAQVGALEQNLRAKRDQAIDTLATSVAAGGSTMAPAKSQLEKLWTTKNNGDMSGLDAKVNERKQWLASQ